MNVKNLDGRMLNFWIARSVGFGPTNEASGSIRDESRDNSSGYRYNYNPANDWSHAGSIVAENWFAIEDTLLEWFGEQWSHLPAVADHPLKWFMRAYVATQFGDEVEDNITQTNFDNTSYQTASASPMHASDNTVRRPWYKVLGW